jgi:organic radical activating enzyme
MRLSEIFTSIQGEGAKTGTPALFIRLFGCNLNCPFCDTKYAKDSSRSYTLSPSQLTKILHEGDLQTIIWTGGEPMLQIREIDTVLHNTPELTHHLETNGTIYDERITSFDWITVSPKRKFDRRIPYDELKLVDGFFDTTLLDTEDRSKIWLQPCTTATDININTYKQVWERCIDLGVNFSPRLHILMGMK